MQRRPYLAVIDDDEGMCRALSRLLHSVNMDTNTFRLGQEALRAMAWREPDCVVLDVELPDFSSLELFKRISKIHPTVPVIIMTAWEDDALRNEAIQGGASGFFYKPFADELFLHAIRSALADWREEADPAAGTRHNFPPEADG